MARWIAIQGALFLSRFQQDEHSDSQMFFDASHDGIVVERAQSFGAALSAILFLCIAFADLPMMTSSRNCHDVGKPDICLTDNSNRGKILIAEKVELVELIEPPVDAIPVNASRKFRQDSFLLD
jgi:hypothetical protein